MFNFFKKKQEPEYDVTNLSIKDLDHGFIFDYDMKSWVVEEKYEYDWGNNNFSKEYKVNSGDEVAFLGVEDGADLNISISKSIKLRKIDEDVVEEIRKSERPPKKIHYNEELYYLDADSAGYFRDCGKKTEDWEELIAWDYYNDEEDKIVSIVQWDEHTIEASAGLVLEEFKISNIIPGQ